MIKRFSSVLSVIAAYELTISIETAGRELLIVRNEELASKVPDEKVVLMNLDAK